MATDRRVVVVSDLHIGGAPTASNRHPFAESRHELPLRNENRSKPRMTGVRRGVCEYAAWGQSQRIPLLVKSPE
jgi:hypothetical protein